MGGFMMTDDRTGQETRRYHGWEEYRAREGRNSVILLGVLLGAVAVMFTYIALPDSMEGYGVGHLVGLAVLVISMDYVIVYPLVDSIRWERHLRGRTLRAFDTETISILDKAIEEGLKTLMYEYRSTSGGSVRDRLLPGPARFYRIPTHNIRIDVVTPVHRRWKGTALSIGPDDITGQASWDAVGYLKGAIEDRLAPYSFDRLMY